jgi:hypothetical protein
MTTGGQGLRTCSQDDDDDDDTNLINRSYLVYNPLSNVL